MEHHISAPLTKEQTRQLKCGDRVYLSGIIYTARDAAHKRFVETLEQGVSASRIRFRFSSEETRCTAFLSFPAAHSASFGDLLHKDYGPHSR